MNRFLRLIRHHWMDETDTHKAIPDDMVQRLTARITASEQRHTGEIRICVEASLPADLVWRVHSHRDPLQAVIRDRATDWFGRLGIWDTEHNNGVLIYLLLAERAIEFVADRGLSRRVPASHWQAIVDRMGMRLHDGAYEDGITQALEEVSALLVEHFPSLPDTLEPNELPDLVVRV